MARKPGKPALWSRTFGAYGYTVTVYERRSGGNLYLRWWDPTAPANRKNGKPGNYRIRSLGHTDKTLGEEQARELAARLLSGAHAMATGEITLGVLFAQYEARVSVHKRGQQPKEDRRRIDLWTAYLGADALAEEITKTQIQAFIRDRQRGQIVVQGRKLKPNPSPSTIGADIVFLQSVLNWAVDEGLIGRNPIRRVDRPKTAQPRRPLATHDRFERTLAFADVVDPQQLLRPFLLILEGSGWRVSFICQLRASDIDRTAYPEAPFGRVRFRGEADKVLEENEEVWRPMTRGTREGIDLLFERQPVVGDGFLFPHPERPGDCWDRFKFRYLHEKAQRLAGYGYSCAACGADLGNVTRVCRECGEVDRGPRDPRKALVGPHAYRRKWETERKHLPIEDVMFVQGRKDRRSLEESYRLPDRDSTLAVVLEERKLREVAE